MNMKRRGRSQSCAAGGGFLPATGPFPPRGLSVHRLWQIARQLAGLRPRLFSPI